MSKSIQSSLFFHMGPGLHSRVEAEYFSLQYPHVAFLDQPLDVDFSETVRWARAKIKEHHELCGKPVTLLGHSFGAQIILASLDGLENSIQEIRLLNSAKDSFESFVSLDLELSPQTAMPYSFWNQQSVDDKIALIFQVSSDPRFNSTYWRSDRARALYESIASEKPGLNILTFLKVFKEYLRLGPSNNIWMGPTTVFYSLDDALIRSFSTVQNWKQNFPKVDFQEIPQAGHHAHFEQSQVADIFFKV